MDRPSQESGGSASTEDWYYLAALFRARQQQSLDGVLSVADACAALGDQAVVDQYLRIAEHLAAQTRNVEARGRVRAFRDRLTVRGSDIDPF